jgi:enoyl-CoA hydratase/carnithine racemase
MVSCCRHEWADREAKKHGKVLVSLWLPWALLTKCKTREQHAKVQQSYGQSFHDALVLGAHAQSIARDTFDHKEGVSAFIEKRPPRFQGRQRCALKEDQLMPGGEPRD